MSERTDILPGDLLEEEGQKNRKESLWQGSIATFIITLLTAFIVMLKCPIPYLWILVAIFVFVAIGSYGIENIDPGCIGQLEWFGKRMKKYYGHGKSWIPRILGFKLIPVNIQVEIRKMGIVTVLDKNNAKVHFHGFRAKYQIVRPYSFCLNITREKLEDEVDSKSKEALREKSGRTTYEKLKRMTSVGQKSIKTNIELKLKEEQDLGAEMVSIEWENVTADEIVETEDQELIARDKRMKQVNEHVDQLEERGINPKDAIEQIKVLHGIVPEEKKTEKKEINFEFGENVAGFGQSLLDLIPKKSKEKEKKK